VLSEGPDVKGFLGLLPDLELKQLPHECFVDLLSTHAFDADPKKVSWERNQSGD
jgi:hypothetical protein